jgi:TPP-dependent 2-oxoacid decarboxylase
MAHMLSLCLCLYVLTADRTIDDVWLAAQVTAQDVSTMLRCGQKSIIFLINNGGYTIEVEIHDGPYNVIKNWDYTGLVNAIHNSEGNCWTMKVCRLDRPSSIQH